MNSPVLVTGATGFVGSHLVERLVDLGFRVRATVRASSSLRNLPQTGVDVRQADLVAGTGLGEALDGVSTVFHVAGVTKTNRPEEYHRGNVLATEGLLRACEANDRPPRLVHVSSLAAVGPSPDGRLLDEDAEPHPLSLYGTAKLASEQSVRRSKLAGTAVIVRPPVVYGQRDTDVLEVFRGIARGWMVRIGGPESSFSFIHVKDLADALIAAALSPGAAGKTYFAANAAPVTWDEFASVAAKAMKRNVRTIAVPVPVAYGVGCMAEIASRLRGRPGIISRDKVKEARHPYWVCATDRALGDLNFTPARSLAQGVEETLAWYRSAGWLRF